MIMADPEAYWKTLASRGTHKNVVFKEEALKEYKGNFSSHEAVHAVCPYFLSITRSVLCPYFLYFLEWGEKLELEGDLTFPISFFTITLDLDLSSITLPVSPTSSSRARTTLHLPTLRA
jgi:hypothetical protein